MADDTPLLQLVDTEADGYCDPETGVCVWPGAPVEHIGEEVDVP